MSKPEVLLMCLADPSRDPRPFRTIQLCKDIGADVYLASLQPKNPIDVKNIFAIKQLSSRPGDKIIRKVLGFIVLFLPLDKLRNATNDKRFGLENLRKDVQGKKFDLIIVEDLYLLPIAHEIKSTAKIIFDAREYYPEQSSESVFWRLTERFNRIRLCHKYLSKCNAVLTVSPGLAEAYKKNFGIDCHIIRSVPMYRDFLPTTPTEKIRMIHHGGAMRNRKLENMIKLFEFLDHRFELNFYLVGESAYIKYLQRLAEPYPQIRFHDPVEFSNITEMLSFNDVGLYLLEPTGFNVFRALPNKFFEFIQARLMLAIGPSPDMAQLVNQYACGIIADSFCPKNLAEKLNLLTTDQIYNFKKNSQKAAKALCWETESQKLVQIINSLLNLESKS